MCLNTSRPHQQCFFIKKLFNIFSIDIRWQNMYIEKQNNISKNKKSFIYVTMYN
jgi:hypothetical protein